VEISRRRFAFTVVLATVAVATHDAGAAQVAPVWPLRLDGWGPVSIGMTVSQLEAAAGDRIGRPDEELSGCTYRQGRGDWDGVDFMMIRGKLVRIDVRSPAIAAQSGARLGTTEAELQAMYGALLETTPHAYGVGHYLTVHGTGSRRKQRLALRFETDENGRVTSFYAGPWRYVQLVEGCT
jgi:hypothetical protein